MLLCTSNLGSTSVFLRRISPLHRICAEVTTDGYWAVSMLCCTVAAPSLQHQPLATVDFFLCRSRILLFSQHAGQGTK